jgi:uncharacterized membrane protein
MSTDRKRWHKNFLEKRTFGDLAADWVANFMGSWTFIIIQTCFVTAWIIFNIFAFQQSWDPYPFILLNLLFSTQASYAAPIIMMSQNRQASRDRVYAYADYETNFHAKKEIEQLQIAIARIENEKLNHIIEMVEKEKTKRAIKKSSDPKQKTTLL